MINAKCQGTDFRCCFMYKGVCVCMCVSMCHVCVCLCVCVCACVCGVCMRVQNSVCVRFVLAAASLFTYVVALLLLLLLLLRLLLWCVSVTVHNFLAKLSKANFSEADFRSTVFAKVFMINANVCFVGEHEKTATYTALYML